MDVEIFDQEEALDDELVSSFLQCCQECLVARGIVSKQVRIEMSVAVVNKAEMQRLNNQYRRIDEPTDVLSFCYEKNDDLVSGEIIICPAVIKKYALEDGVVFVREVCKNVAHGLLHNLGYEHGEKMFALQEEMIEYGRITGTCSADDFTKSLGGV